MSKYKQLFNRSTKILSAAAIMSSAVVVPYVVNAEEPVTTTEATYTVVSENVNYAFSSGADINTPGMGDAYVKPIISQVDLVFDNAGNPYADITFNKSAASYSSFKVGNADGAEIAPIKTVGESGSDDYSRTIRVALDEKYQSSVYLVNSAMAARSTTIHFDLVEEAFDFTYLASTEQAYFGQWLPNADFVQSSNGNYALLTLAGHSYGVANFYDKPESDSTRAPYEVLKSVGTQADKTLKRVIKIPLDKNNKGVMYLEHGNLKVSFEFDFTKNTITLEEALATGNELPLSINYSSAVTWHPAIIGGIVKAVSAKKVGDKFDVTIQVDPDGLNKFDLVQNEEKLASFNSKSSLIKFTTSSLDGIKINVTKTAASPTGAISSTDASADISAFKYAPKSALPVETVTATPEVVENTFVKDLSFTKMVAATPKAALDMVDYLSPYFKNFQLFEDANGNQYIRTTLTGKAYGFAELKYIDADGNQQDVTVLSSEGEGLDQVRVIEFPNVTDKNGNINLYVNSGDLGYGAYTLSFTAKDKAFADIDKSYAKADIEALYTAGLVKGKTSIQTFAPLDLSTRAEFSTIIARAFYSDTEAVDIPFKDVPATAWYKEDIQKLYGQGIIKGDGNKFNGNAQITREDAVVILYRILLDNGYKASAPANQLKAYKDTNKISSYAKEAITELNALGIFVGSDNKLDPKGKLERQAMAKLANKVISKVNDLNAK